MKAIRELWRLWKCRDLIRNVVCDARDVVFYLGEADKHAINALTASRSLRKSAIAIHKDWLMEVERSRERVLLSANRLSMAMLQK